MTRIHFRNPGRKKGSTLVPAVVRLDIKKRYAKGQTTKEIAEKLKLNRGTVEKLLRPYLKRLAYEAASAQKKALEKIKHVTQGNVIKASEVVARHLDLTLADDEKLAKLSIDEVLKYQELSTAEHTKLAEAPKAEYVDTQNNLTVNLPDQLAAMDRVNEPVPEPDNLFDSPIDIEPDSGPTGAG